MDPWARYHEMKAYPTLYLLSKPECFLINGYQDMNLILHSGGVLDFDLWPHPLGTLGSDVMEWKLTLLGTYGPSMNAF